MQQDASISSFHVTTMPAEKISGSNLVEASAGTGKTYSIALLVLRLIIEKDIPVFQQLIVTFTNAAVAELQHRIRKFLAQAAEYADEEPVEDENIRSVVDRAIQQSGIKREVVKERLKASLIMMDESVIVTIHSFCQQMLNKYAFDTKQTFDVKLQENISDILEDEFNKCWRRHITTLPAEVLSALNIITKKNTFPDLIKKHLSGRRYALFTEDKDYTINGDELLTELQRTEREAEQDWNNALRLFKIHEDAIIGAVKNFELKQYLDDAEAFVTKAIAERTKGRKYVEKFPEAFLKALEMITNRGLERDIWITTRIAEVRCFALQKVIPGLQSRLERSGIMTFDNLIQNLWKVLQAPEGNEHFISRVRNDFKAVFIDEFQDTDRVQFDIFSKLFLDSTECITFLIGDPKQSIYAFRGADISGYMEAKGRVDRAYTMNVNYRSTEQMIAAANTFFLPEEDFDTFYFPGQSGNSIRYVPVKSAQNHGNLLQHQAPVPAISLMSFKNKTELKQAIAEEISRLLQPSNAFQIRDKQGELRPVKPADIGVLVRTTRAGTDIKELLETLNIPAVIRNDGKVMQSDTAKDTAVLLKSVTEPSVSNIRRALFSRLIGWSRQQLQEADDEKLMERFRAYQLLWFQENTYTVLSRIKKDFGLEERLIKLPGGMRILSDFVQVMQLLHQYQHRKKLSPEELLNWLKKSNQGLENEDDEFELQMESDEDAVKIVTIHKSKGLEYNIVFCEDLSFKSETSSFWEFAEFKTDQPNGTHVFADIPLLTEEWKHAFETQTEQENRRLMYVAITRAVYKCYIGYSLEGKQALSASSSLAPFLSATGNAHPQLIATFQANTAPALPYSPEIIPEITSLDYNANDIIIAGSNWRKMSYSALAAKSSGHIAPQDEKSAEVQNDYDHFVFEILHRGSYTGNMLHFLLEQLNFKESQLHHFAVERSLKQFLQYDQQYEVYLPQLVRQIIQTNLNAGDHSFSLSTIPAGSCLKEMEFDFMVPPLRLRQILEVIANHIPARFSLTDNSVLEGFMNGFIDLFFEHEGRYYILDWKSNYLGNDLSYYTGESLESAMTTNNYHLQYLIYTLAAHKFLKSRLGNQYRYDRHFGGAFYAFLRGVRAHTGSGIFYTKPPAEIILKLDELL